MDHLDFRLLALNGRWRCGVTALAKKRTVSSCQGDIQSAANIRQLLTIEREGHRQTDRQTDRQTMTERDIHTYMVCVVMCAKVCGRE